MSNATGFKEFWKERQVEMAADSDLRLLNDARVTVVHRSSLVPSSSMFIGHFKYGKPKSGIEGMPLDPMTDSVAALAHGRKVFQSHEHPHRMWSGEEFGLQRLWALKEAPKTELVQFALNSLAKIAGVFSATHEWAGFGALKTGNCEHFNSEDYRNLRESEVFLEVSKAWDGHPTEKVSPISGELSLFADPSETGDVLHKIPAGKAAKGWVGTLQSRFWGPEFASMLLYSIDDETITKDTAAFFKRSAASVSTLDDPESPDEPDSEE
jgi:hypothetical protein